MRIGSLFSGIGGLDRGIEMAVPSACIVWQADNDPHARAVLRRWWPVAKIYEDVREIDERAEQVDIVCGGSPCQDLSNAGRRDGISGARSGLWSEFARIVAELRPAIVFFENVAAIASAAGRSYCSCTCQRRQPPFAYGTVCQFCGRPMGAAADEPAHETALGTVLGDLASLGYDAEWTTVRASDVGAPHRRERLFILAYADRERVRELCWGSGGAGGTCQAEPADDGAAMADAHGSTREQRGPLTGVRAGAAEKNRRGAPEPSGRGHVADADRKSGRRDERASSGGDSGEEIRSGEAESGRCGGPLANPDGHGQPSERVLGLLDGERPSQRDDSDRCDCPRCYVHRFPPGPDQISGWDGPECAVRRSATRVPGRLRNSDALRLLGNCAVPQQAAVAFRALAGMAVEAP